ncbi:MAG: RsmB/NOP family class I SAM-dependent RNA methyltransferase [Gemmatimonadetes bacterium]|nr:RsmB/NOP family class I SAM-dependent RNA methyltransferase [Gemmatimonadota bacterium]
MTRVTTDLGFPAEFIQRMTGLLGQEATGFLSALEWPAAGLRVNTLRLSPAQFEEISPFPVTPLAYPPGGYLLGDEGRPGKHPYHAAGLYYMQDPGAMTVAAALGPLPGERILDLAAAPGGKATHIAALLGGTGLLVANDMHPLRARELARNLERLGVRNAVVTCESAGRLADHFGAFFDRVLLDAPCSGESMFAKSEAARREWSGAAVLGCARRQVDLLAAAARLVRPGGLIVYSTCTFSPAENEGAAAAFVREHPGFEIAAMDAVAGAEGGRADWLSPGERVEGLERTLRLWPHRVPGAGHFIAGFRSTAGGAPGEAREWNPSAPRNVVQLVADFTAKHLRGAPPLERRLEVVGDEVYGIPPGTPELKRLRVVRPGWWLGTLLKNRFEPAHAMALGLRGEDGEDPVVLAPDDPVTHAYLRGEAISVPGRAGWTLVTVDGFVLGWGKRVGDVVKNHYPKGLRWR